MVTNLLNQTFGRLTVQRQIAERKFGSIQWECLCTCGKTTYVPTCRLKNGMTSSCGCLRLERMLQKTQTHGACKGYVTIPEYNVWTQMKNRCHKTNHRMYHHYGARGIFVCERWRESFQNFIEDMGKRPSDKHTLERIDNNGPYSPENCSWELISVQANNKRNNVKITFNGETLTVSQWSRKLGIPNRTLNNRYHRNLPVEQILFVGKLPHKS